MSEPLVPQTASPDPSPVAPAPVAPEPASAGGFFQNLVDVFFSPREAFTRIVRRPSFWLPAIG